MLQYVRIKLTAICHKFTQNIGYISLTVTFVVLSFVNVENIKYFQPQTISMEPHSTQIYRAVLNDSISKSNALFKVSSKDNTPIFFYREIFTPVCFDNKCRPLNIKLYWNITGRYLGFELPEGEFLSKTDHDPFTTEEYENLNRILANESTPLATIDYDQLTIEPNNQGSDDVDAITTATPRNLAQYVINGAAYTTFKLWHLIHGATKNEVQNFTISDLSPALVLKILDSPVQADKIWALEHIDGHVDFTTELKEKVFGLVKGDNYIIVEKALNAIGKNELGSYEVQHRLMEALLQEDYNVQIRVIEKMLDCDVLKNSVTLQLVDNLGDLNGQVLNKSLLVLGNQNLTPEMYHRITELLRSENRFISNSVKTFLKNENIKDPQILSLLKDEGN